MFFNISYSHYYYYIETTINVVYIDIFISVLFVDYVLLFFYRCIYSNTSIKY